MPPTGPESGTGSASAQIAELREARALFLDEPMSGLDPKAAADFIGILRTLREEGKAILMSTHDIGLALMVVAGVSAARVGYPVAGSLRVAEGLGPAFAVGVSRDLDAYPGRTEPDPRIYVKIRPDGTELPVVALLDTGGHFCALNRDIAMLIRQRLTDRLRQVVLRTAHGPIHGELYLHTIELLAEAGENLDVTSTVFLSRPADLPRAGVAAQCPPRPARLRR